MKTDIQTLVVSLVALFVFLVTTPVFAQNDQSIEVRVNSNTTDQSLNGTDVSYKFRIVSSGVRGKTRTPFGTVESTVGETVRLGSLASIPSKRTELLVSLPWGEYYRPVKRSEIKSGSIRVDVYPMGDNSDLTIAQHGILIQPLPGRIMVREVLTFNNESERMAGGVDNPLKLDLPDEVESVIPGPGMGSRNDLLQKGDRRHYRLLIPPGRSQLGYFYMIRTDADQFSMDRTVTRKTSQLVASIQSFESIDVSVEGLKKGNPPPRKSKKSGPKPVRFTGGDLSQGEKFSIRIDGLKDMKMSDAKKSKSRPDRTGSKSTSPETDRRPSSISTLNWPLILSIGFSFLIFVSAYGFVQYKLSGESDNGSLSRSFLLEEIARLDQEFDDGAIDEPYYKRTRRRWKKRAQETDESDE